MYSKYFVIISSTNYIKNSLKKIFIKESSYNTKNIFFFNKYSKTINSIISATNNIKT